MTDTEAVGTVTMTTTEFQAFMDRAAREARAEHWNEGYRAGYSIGRADALREVAERVRALRDDPQLDGDTFTFTRTVVDATGMGWDAILAILDPQP